LIGGFYTWAQTFSLWCFLYRASPSSERFRYSYRPTKFIKNHYSWMDSVMTEINRVDSPERLEEIGAVLADALMRLRHSKSSAFPGEFGESSLHFTPDQSSDANPVSPEVTA
jgi:hypothetical protein